jgi:bifunctional UDP-N-acetylglucosamine pyrophosphorylase/glucosamine-1-phosphate N-acetyltransferase
LSLTTVAVILAAGMGTRMKSTQPKVLHKIAGVPIIKYVLEAVEAAGVKEIIIVLGHQAEKVKEELGEAYHYVYQRKQLGTGHALRQALPLLEKYAQGNCLVLCGDTPLLSGETLRNLREKHSEAKAKATVLTAILENPSGYGRIIKGVRGIEKIVEENEASPLESEIKEINTGAYCFALGVLQEGLKKLSPVNLQGEYYLTDIIKFLVEEKEIVETYVLPDSREAWGINTRVQLAAAEAVVQQKILNEHLLNGVTIIDPAHTYVARTVKIDLDTILYPGTILEGKTSIEANCLIGPYTRIANSFIGAGTRIENSTLDMVTVGKNCFIGPYSYLRPGTRLAENVRIGGFVEVKNTFVGKSSKIPHLSYVGDSLLGEDVNIGAGTITCNYDGKKKSRTFIEDQAFVGSNTNFVAPVKIGKGAYIGAGSTITKDVPPGALALARGKQKNLVDWCQKKNKRED